jgi:hypothetical protein
MLEHDDDGNVVEAFMPDFFLPDAKSTSSARRRNGR